jgi:hypothetical protein
MFDALDVPVLTPMPLSTLYEPGGKGCVPLIRAAFPDAAEDGSVNQRGLVSICAPTR